MSVLFLCYCIVFFSILRSNTISYNENQQLKQEIIKNKNSASQNIQKKYEEIRRAVEEKEYLTKSLKEEQVKTAVLEEQKNEILR